MGWGRGEGDGGKEWEGRSSVGEEETKKGLN